MYVFHSQEPSGGPIAPTPPVATPLRPHVARAIAEVMAVLNIMPKKDQTAQDITQFFAKVSESLETKFYRIAGYTSRDPERRLEAQKYPELAEAVVRASGGLLITGAPVETKAFGAVDYYPQVTQAVNNALEAEKPVTGVCWGGNVILKHVYGIDPHILPTYADETGNPLRNAKNEPIHQKLYGVYEHQVNPKYRHALGETLLQPVSRSAYYTRDQFAKFHALEIIAESQETGVGVLYDARRKIFIVLNHPEYNAGTLKDEFIRHRGEKADFPAPENYPLRDQAAQAALHQRFTQDGVKLYQYFMNKMGLSLLLTPRIMQPSAMTSPKV